MKKLLVSLMAVFAIANISVAQEAAIKWNPLYLGLGSVNLGIEFSVAPKWTLAFEGNAVIFNPWQNGDNSIYANGWTGTFEARWYTCEAFNGHHLGLYGTVGRFGEASSNFDLFNKIALGGHGATGATNVKARSLLRLLPEAEPRLGSRLLCRRRHPLRNVQHAGFDRSTEERYQTFALPSGRRSFL